MTVDTWSEERIAFLKRRWGDGATASVIAAELGSVTRNAVVGKAHRLGLAGRESPIGKGSRGRQRKAREEIKRAWDANLKASAAARDVKLARKPAAAMAHRSSPASTPARQLDRMKGRTCAWPIGDPRAPKFRFCGSPEVVAGRPYCAAHCDAAYEPLSRARTGAKS